MEKLAMCRICLVEDVRMYVVFNKNLMALYEKLTDVPFVTEDCRPMLACFFCYAKLKQCEQFQRKCLEAEALLTLMLIEDCEKNSLKNPIRLGFYGGFSKTVMEHTIIYNDECILQHNSIKEEPPDVCERKDDIIEPEEEHQSEDLELKHLHDSYEEVEDISPHHSAADSEDEQPLMQFKTEVKEEQEVPLKIESAVETERTFIGKTPNLVLQTIKLKDTITDEQMENEQLDSKMMQNTQNKNDLKRDQRSLNQVEKFKQLNPKHISKNLYKCDTCQRKFSVKGSLVKHIRVHNNEKLYKCEICQCCFREKIFLTNHVCDEDESGEISYNCDLNKHMRILSGKKPYKCENCQRCFSRFYFFKRHIPTPPFEELYKCKICERSFRSKQSLTDHSRIHTGERPYECDICKRKFSRKECLKKHILGHTEMSYICDICKRGFKEKKILIAHVLKHMGEEPFQCDICQRCFKAQNRLENHMRVHTGEKPFQCLICKKSFSQKSGLRIHARLHTGEMPYKCKICQRSFRNGSNLIKHRRRMHKD